MSTQEDYNAGIDPLVAGRYRLAQSMLQNGMDTSPIRSKYQGLARVMQAVMGGWNLSNINQQQKDADKEYLSAVDPTAGADTNSGAGVASSPIPSGTAPAAGSAPAAGVPDFAAGMKAAGAVQPAADPAAASAGQDSLTPFIKSREGLKLTAYPDGTQHSIGYGTKATSPNETIDQAEADRRLQVELGKARGLVQAFAPNASKAQQDALTDLTYNSGTRWMNQTLGHAVKGGDWQTAARQFAGYVHDSNGNVLKGLVVRRLAMAPNLLQSGDPAGPAPAVPTAPDAPVRVASAGDLVPVPPGTQNPDPGMAAPVPPGAVNQDPGILASAPPSGPGALPPPPAGLGGPMPPPAGAPAPGGPMPPTVPAAALPAALGGPPPPPDAAAAAPPPPPMQQPPAALPPPAAAPTPGPVGTGMEPPAAQPGPAPLVSPEVMAIGRRLMASENPFARNQGRQMISEALATAVKQRQAMSAARDQKIWEMNNVPEKLGLGDRFVIPGKAMAGGGAGGNEVDPMTPGNPDLTGDDYIQSIQSKAERNRVQSILAGREQYPAHASQRNLPDLRVKNAVNIADTSFNEAMWRERMIMRNELAKAEPNSAGGQANRGNTALEHLAEMKYWAGIIGQYHNGGTIPGGIYANQGRDWLNTGTDSPLGKALTAYNEAKGHFVEEATAFYKGGQASDGAIAHHLGGLDPSNGPENIQTAINENSDLIYGKVRTLQDQWDHLFTGGNGKIVEPRAIISPAAQAAADYLGNNAPDAQLPNFKKLRDTKPPTADDAAGSGDVPDTPAAPKNPVVTLGGKQYEKLGPGQFRELP